VSQRGGRYLTLDDPVIAELARTDPSALVNGAAGFTVIDEVQSASGLFPALKREVDRHPVPGRFLLTGSANAFMLPKTAESLAGRMEVLTPEPLAQCEIEGSPHNLIDALFGHTPWAQRADRPGRSCAPRDVERIPRGPGSCRSPAPGCMVLRLSGEPAAARRARLRQHRGPALHAAPAVAAGGARQLVAEHGRSVARHRHRALDAAPLSGAARSAVHRAAAAGVVGQSWQAAGQGPESALDRRRAQRAPARPDR